VFVLSKRVIKSSKRRVQARRPCDSVYDVFVYVKSGRTQMPNSNDIASNEVLWEHVLPLLVVVRACWADALRC
jgi:hypothetical protein